MNPANNSYSGAAHEPESRRQLKYGPLNCKLCHTAFMSHHFNSKLCSPSCQLKARKQSLSKFKATEKWEAGNKRYMQGEAFKSKEQRYRSKASSKKLAVRRAAAYLSRHDDARIKQKVKSFLYFQTEAGRIVRRRASKKYKQSAKGRAQQLKRNKQRSSACIGQMDKDTWQAILACFLFRCACCGTEKNITCDHIVPVSLGGTNSPHNLQPLCLSCNSHKGNRTRRYRRPDSLDDLIKLRELTKLINSYNKQR